MIFKVDDVFVISSRDVWLPGRYDTEATARYAFRFPRIKLKLLQERKNAENGGTDGIITLTDLRGLT